MDTKNECVKEIGLRAQNVLIKHSRLRSQLNWDDLHDHLISKGIFTLTMNKIFM